MAGMSTMAPSATVTLTCINPTCGRSKTFPATASVRGKSLADWWRDDRHQLCLHCFTASTTKPVVAPTPVQVSPQKRRTRTIEELFVEFHTANPWVYRELVRLARVAKSNGRNTWGIGSLFEVLRWKQM